MYICNFVYLLSQCGASLPVLFKMSLPNQDLASKFDLTWSNEVNPIIRQTHLGFIKKGMMWSEPQIVDIGDCLWLRFPHLLCICVSKSLCLQVIKAMLLLSAAFCPNKSLSTHENVRAEKRRKKRTMRFQSCLLCLLSAEWINPTSWGRLSGTRSLKC